jgi:hypothetical protein
MNIAKKVLAGVAIACMALSGAVITGGPAEASTVPVVYSANADGWHGYVRPATIYFGQGGAPILADLHWSWWNGASAWATGRLRIQQPGCSPSYKCPYYSRPVAVSLNTVRWHTGTRYYARMEVRFWYAGKWRWDTGWLRNGYWVFPATFPYL